MARQKILIVDDSKTIRMQLRDLLPKGNFEILEAKDGVEGFELISQERPNLILIDFFMPRMNGWEVVQKVQMFPRLQSIPIVMMSGRRDDVEKAVPELFEYFEFVSKPFEQRLLIKAIQSATSKAKQRYQVLRESYLTVSKTSATTSNADSIVHALANHASTNHDLQGLHTQLQHLQQENSRLKAELEGVKKQVSQLMALVQQRGKRAHSG